MTGAPAGEKTEELAFRRITGEPVRTVATVGCAESSVGKYLIARDVRLGNATEVRQLRVMAGAHRDIGYERLDNEILAGRRLYNLTEEVGYPPGVSRLYGDEAESADPYALLEPYKGEPLEAVVRQMMPEEQQAFEVSLLTALCWLEAVGIAHRGLSPSAVRWDASALQVQITDFSLCTVFGVPREAIGSREWGGPEQRSGGKVSGLVTECDDMHAAGRLIFYVRSQGEKLQNRSQLAEVGLAELDPLFGPPEDRPTARKLLAGRPGGGDPIPRGIGRDSLLKDGQELFDVWRDKKHPGVAGPEADSGPAGASRDSAQGDTVMAEASNPGEPPDQGKRSRWRRGRP